MGESLSQAIDEAIATSGFNNRQLSIPLSTTGATVGRWRKGVITPTLAAVNRLEEELSLPRGTLLIRAGYVGGYVASATTLEQMVDVTVKSKECRRLIRALIEHDREGWT